RWWSADLCRRSTCAWTTSGPRRRRASRRQRGCVAPGAPWAWWISTCTTTAASWSRSAGAPIARYRDDRHPRPFCGHGRGARDIAGPVRAPEPSFPPNYPMQNAIVVLFFVLTYLGMAAGRLPWLQVDRTGIALIGVILLLVTEASNMDSLI